MGYKNGAYDFVECMVGDMENVIGLPTKKVIKAMEKVEQLLLELD